MSSDLFGTTRAVKRENVGQLLERFFVSAVVSILVIRFFLHLTHYPQLGGHGFHIAHLLWGGALMLLALLLLYTYRGVRVLQAASVVGGVGFGMFLDELGKFITSDNNYFFQPTVAIMYVILIGLLLVVRWLSRERPLSQREAMVLALYSVADALNDGSNSRKRRHIISLLRQGKVESLVRPVEELLTRSQRASVSPIMCRLEQWQERLVQFYQQLTQWRLFAWGVICWFVLAAAGSVVIATALAVGLFKRGALPNAQLLGQLSVPEYLALCSSAVSVLFVVLAAWRWRRDRLAAYQALRWSVLVSLLLTQVFNFYIEEFSALGGLVVDVVMLSVLDYLMDQERGAAEDEDQRPGWIFWKRGWGL